MNARAALVVALAGVAVAHASPSAAQGAFPSKPVQVVVPNPPGGSNDIFARALSKRLAEAWGKPVVVENKPGASASVGAAYVAKAAADGHTLLVVSSSFATNAAVQKHQPFDSVKDFAPVAMLGKGPFILGVANALPAKSVAELLALAKAKPGALNYASSGPGSINQFATELFKSAAGVQMTHVPYKGMNAAGGDLVGGHVDVLIASVPSILSAVRSGKVRALGVTSATPSAAAPGLPAIAQSGVPGYAAEIWWGVLAPAGVPAPVVAAINAEVNRAFGAKELADFLLNEGAEPSPMGADAFAAFLRADIERWRKLAASAGIRAD